METHTLARYISESTLQEYSFVCERPSYVAAGAMYLALHMKNLGPWVSICPDAVETTYVIHMWVCSLCMQTPTLVHYSGYTQEDLIPIVKRLNELLKTPLGQTATVRSKYSHE